MGSAWPCVADRGDHCLLSVAVVPQSRRTGADGLHDGALRVRLAAPPVDGKANEALVAWVAAELGLPRRDVQLLRGAAARRKQLQLALPAAIVSAWLDGVLAEAGDGG